MLQGRRTPGSHMKRFALIVIGVAALARSATPRKLQPRTAAPDVRQGRRADHVQQVRELPSARRSRADVAAVVRRRAAVGEGDQVEGRRARDAAVGRGHDADAADAQRRQPHAERDRHDCRVGRWRRGEGQRRRHAAVPTFASGWTSGTEPDAVLEMPVEFDIPAEGEVGVQMFYSKVPWSEDRFAEIVELHPSNRSVLHHAGIYFVDIPEGTRSSTAASSTRTARSSATAARADCRRPTAACRDRASCCRGCRAAASISIAPNIGKRIPAGKYINWQMHYNPTGTPQKDRTQAGHLVQQGAGDARSADSPGRRSAGDDQGRLVDLSRRRPRDGIQGGSGQHAPQPHHAEHSRRTRRTGTSPASRR